MQFKSKAQLAAEKKSAETSEQTIIADVVSQSPDPTPTPTAEAEAAPAEDNFIQIAVPDYPKQLYDAAVIENEMMDFNTQLGNAMRPVIREYTPPPIPTAIAEATRREMEAGRQRVAEFAEQEKLRRVLVATEQRRKEPWEGNSVSIFRPQAYVPDPKAPDRTGTLRVLNNG